MIGRSLAGSSIFVPTDVWNATPEVSHEAFDRGTFPARFSTTGSQTQRSRELWRKNVTVSYDRRVQRSLIA